METKEKIFNGFKLNGFLVLFLHLIVLTGIILWCFLIGGLPFNLAGGVLIAVWLVLLAGYMQQEPNEARVMVFFR